VLLASSAGRPTEPGARRLAEEHVARCSDCWEVLSLLHELAVGAAPPDAGRMQKLFGCAPVQESMYLLTGLGAAELRAAHPDAARHLGWCHACRERLAELLVVERAAGRGEFGAVLAPPVAPRWRETAERAREAVDRLVAEIRRAGAVLTTVPAGFVLSPLPAPAGALRGAAGGRGPSLGQQVKFALADSGLWAELTLEPEDAERVGIALRVSGGDERQLSVHLREIHADRTELVARHTVLATEPVIVKGIRPGRYVIEILERQREFRFKLRFDVERAA